VAVIDGFTVTW